MLTRVGHNSVQPRCDALLLSSSGSQASEVRGRCLGTRSAPGGRNASCRNGAEVCFTGHYLLPAAPLVPDACRALPGRRLEDLQLEGKFREVRSAGWSAPGLVALLTGPSRVQVVDMAAPVVVDTIEQAFYVAASSILAGACSNCPTALSLELQSSHSIATGQGLRYSVPSRVNANQVYIKELDRIVRGAGQVCAYR